MGINDAGADRLRGVRATQWCETKSRQWASIMSAQLDLGLSLQSRVTGYKRFVSWMWGTSTSCLLNRSTKTRRHSVKWASWSPTFHKRTTTNALDLKEEECELGFRSYRILHSRDKEENAGITPLTHRSAQWVTSEDPHIPGRWTEALSLVDVDAHARACLTWMVPASLRANVYIHCLSEIWMARRTECAPKVTNRQTPMYWPTHTEYVIRLIITKIQYKNYKNTNKKWEVINLNCKYKM